MIWRSTTWARWFGWTLVFALISYWPSMMLAVLRGDRFVVLPGWVDRVAWMGFMVGLVAAVLIGVRFRSFWWVCGPPVAILLPLLFSLLRDQGSRPSYEGVIVLGIGLISALYALVALAGVWWGWHRERDDFPPR